jgi:hypothetical protein
MPESGRGDLSSVGMESIMVSYAAKLALDQWNLAKRVQQSMQTLTADEMASYVDTLPSVIQCGWNCKLGATTRRHGGETGWVGAAGQHASIA